MSSYALSAIQMMTPSTFRRRNITGRPISNDLHQNKSTTVQRRNRRGQNRMKAIPSQTSLPPKTLTICDNNTSGSSGNLGLSQLTMSQLSDSMSHRRSVHRIERTRPSKVARTANQSRPSAQPSNGLSTISNGRFREYSGESRVLKSASNGSTPAGSRRNSSSEQQVPKKADTQSSQEIFKTDINTQDDDCHSQLRSQKLLLSPPPARRTRSRTRSQTHDRPAMDCRCNLEKTPSNRKRSWMEACIDVMKTPYRKGKSIARRASMPMVKIDEDENSNIVDDNKAILALKTSQPSDLLQTIEKNENEINSSIVNTGNCSSMPPNALQVLDESKELWKKIEFMKKEFEKERIELQEISSSVLNEMREERMDLTKERKELNKTKNELQALSNDLEQKKDKFAVQICSAEEKFNANVHMFEVKQTEALHDLHTVQTNIVHDLSTKKEDLVSNLDSRKLQFETLRKDVLNEVEAKNYSYESILKEMKLIHDKFALITPVKCPDKYKTHKRKLAQNLHDELSSEDINAANGSRTETVRKIRKVFPNQQLTDREPETTLPIEQVPPVRNMDLTTHFVSNSEGESDGTENHNDGYLETPNQVKKVKGVNSSRSSKVAKTQLAMYNFRSKVVIPSEQQSMEHISKGFEDDQKIASMIKVKLTTEKERTERNTVSCSQNKINCPPSVAPLIMNFQSKKGSNMRKVDLQKQTAMNSSQQKRSSRRRRIGGLKLRSNNGLSRIHKDSLGPSSHSRSVYGTVQNINSDNQSQANILGTASLLTSRHLPAPPISSPVGVDSVLGPPPIPQFNGASSPVSLLAPRFSFLPNDSDSLSFA